MFEIVKSLIIIGLISSTVSTCCFYFYNINFTGVFVLTSVIQLAMSWFLRTYLTSRETQLSLETKNKMLEQIEQEATQAPCAYCGEINLIPIIPDDNNDFNCIACGESNSVYVSITIAQQTVPVDATRYEVTNHNSDLSEAKSKILKTIEDE